MRRLLLNFSGCFLVAGTSAFAAGPFNDYTSTLGGSTADFLWLPLLKPSGVSSGTDGNTSQWMSGMAPTNGAVGARFSGNPNFAGETTDFLSTGGIYTFFSETHFRVTTTDPKTGLVSLTLQIQIADSFISAPSLSVTTAGGTQTVAATYSLIESDQPGNIGGFDTQVKVYGYQWDLSGLGSAITGYTIDWQVPMHTVLGGQEVTESNAVHHENILSAVPEPASSLFLGTGLGLLALRRPSRRRAPASAI